MRPVGRPAGQVARAVPQRTTNADHAEVSTTIRRNIMMKREDAMKMAEEKYTNGQALEQDDRRCWKTTWRSGEIAQVQLSKLDADHFAISRGSACGRVHTWRTMIRAVKKGESGIAILAPLIRRARKEDSSAVKHRSTSRCTGSQDGRFQ